jgi:hypothetical protein
MPTIFHRTPMPPQRRSPVTPVLGLLIVAVGAFLITGTILTLGLILIPAFLFGLLAYALWQHRRVRPAEPAPTDAVVPDDSASSATERSI